MSLEPQAPKSLLSCPPISSVPLAASFISRAQAAWSDNSRPLLIPETTVSAPPLAALLWSALTRAWPFVPTSELQLSIIWDIIGMGFPEEVGDILKLPLHHTRHVFCCTYLQRILLYQEMLSTMLHLYSVWTAAGPSEPYAMCHQISCMLL